MVEMGKRIAFILPALAVLAAACSVIGGKSPGDITVMPLGDEVKVTDGSLVYALPLTVFEIDIIAEKRVDIPGPYARYADEMIGLDNVVVVNTPDGILVARKDVSARAGEVAKKLQK